MNIYVGNLVRSVTNEDLLAAFKTFGEVKSATIVTDKFTHDPRGFGFVEMNSKTEAQAAISGLNGTDMQGQTLKVNEARPKEERTNSFSNSRNTRDGGRRY